MLELNAGDPRRAPADGPGRPNEAGRPQAPLVEQRPFGRDGRLVSVIGFGCGRIGSFGNPTPLAEIRRTLERALECGINLFDTADIYGQGDSEREIGRLLRGRRDRAVVVTKVGRVFSARMRLLRPLKPLLKPLLARAGSGEGVAARRASHMALDFSPAHIRSAVDASLRRLATPVIDALLLHSPPAEAAGSQPVAQTLSALRAAGKVRQFGVACDDMATLEAALAMPDIGVVELPIAVLDEACRRGHAGRFGAGGIAVLVREAIRHQPGVPPAEAVARVAARPGVASVVVGVSQRHHLDDLLHGLPR